jgi:hypothetical protein
LTLGNRLGFIAIIERLELRIASLEERIASTQKRGRPQRKSYPWNATDAERNAALIVAGLKAEWRKEHGRQRVPPAETEDMITAPSLKPQRRSACRPHRSERTASVSP